MKCLLRKMAPGQEMWAIPLISEFLKKSGDKEMGIGMVIEQLKEATQSCCAWFIFEEKYRDLVGYLFVSIQKAEYGSFVGVINGLYLDPKKVPAGFIKEIDAELQRWAKESGIQELAFFTRRNPKAFVRSLGNGWGLDSYVLKRKV